MHKRQSSTCNLSSTIIFEHAGAFLNVKYLIYPSFLIADIKPLANRDAIFRYNCILYRATERPSCDYETHLVALLYGKYLPETTRVVMFTMASMFTRRYRPTNNISWTRSVDTINSNLLPPGIDDIGKESARDSETKTKITQTRHKPPLRARNSANGIQKI